MSVDHYENFPVASLLLPARLRPAVKAIYAFARAADDVADEGDARPAARLERLGEFRQALDACVSGAPIAAADLQALFEPLGRVIRQHSLPLQAFHDLLDAFVQDVSKQRYATFAELQDYCRCSANPVGRLLLCLYEAETAENIRRSDAICTSLQLINFLQDVAIDWDKGRIYLPQDEMAGFGITAADIDAACADDARWQQLMSHQRTRAQALMRDGAALALDLGGRIGWELRLIVLGGLRILERIEAVGDDIFRQRPQLVWQDWLVIGWRALNYRNHA